MKEKKIFLSVMKTYLVLVMILLIVLIGCSFYSYQSFKSNTKNAQVALLNQVQHEMDIRLENISNDQPASGGSSDCSGNSGTGR